MMHGREKSDPAIRAMKPANKAGGPAAEWVEQRAGAEGNAGQPHTRRAQYRGSVTQGRERVRQADALPSITRGGSRVRELRPLGSVRGVPGNRHPYRDMCIARDIRGDFKHAIAARRQAVQTLRTD